MTIGWKCVILGKLNIYVRYEIIMQIISGRYRGKKLLHYSSDVTRPTIGRIRESVFNVLSNMLDGGFEGKVALDLFAGSGAYGLECYSRGAGQVIFNDVDARAVDVIKKNVASIKCQNAVILNYDFRKVLEQFGRYEFDVVFLDPPYDSDIGLFAIDKVKLKRSGIIVFETDERFAEKYDIEFAGYEVKQKIYGDKIIYFLVRL